MMKKAFMVMALSAVVAASAFAAPGAAQQPAKATVGDFAVKVASALGYAVPDQKVAVESLQKRGVDLRADLGATLTEGEAARIMSDLGMVVVAPSNPEAPVSPAMAGFLAGTVSADGARNAGATLDNGFPVQCLYEYDRGHCVDCCKAATGLTGKPCNRFCRAITHPGVSPSEPAP